MLWLTVWGVLLVGVLVLSWRLDRRKSVDEHADEAMAIVFGPRELARREMTAAADMLARQVD